MLKKPPTIDPRSPSTPARIWLAYWLTWSGVMLSWPRFVCN